MATTSRRKPSPRHPTPGAPAGYSRLTEFFPTQTLRARALGAKRDTIRTWDEARATRLRHSSEGRVALVLRVCLEAQRYMADATDVGRWMLTPQPRLRGASPVSLLSRLGDRAFAQVQEAVERATRGDTTLACDWSDDFWHAVEAELRPDISAEIQAAYEQVRAGAIPPDVDIYELL